MSLIQNWIPNKEFTEFDIVQFINESYILINKDRFKDSSVPKCTKFNVLPIKSINISNGINSRSTEKFVSELISLLPSDTMDNSDNNWIRIK